MPHPAPPPGLREQSLGPHTLRWIFDQPARRNAIGPQVFEWIAQRCAKLAGEAVILRGAGDQAFSAGFDLVALAERKLEPSAAPPDASLIAASAAMERADATFIAAINGYVIGAGVELVAACDLRLACAGASVRVPAARLGVVYHAAGLRRIHAAFGSAVARRLLLCGERVAIEELRASLVAIVPLEQLDERAEALAQELAELGEGARASLAANRRLLRALDSGEGLPRALLDAHEQARRSAYQRLS